MFSPLETKKKKQIALFVCMKLPAQITKATKMKLTFGMAKNFANFLMALSCFLLIISSQLFDRKINVSIILFSVYGHFVISYLDYNKEKKRKKSYIFLYSTYTNKGVIVKIVQ